MLCHKLSILPYALSADVHFPAIMTQPHGAVVKAASRGRVSKGGFLSHPCVDTNERQDKKRVFEKRMTNSGRHSKAENGGAAVEQPQIHSRAFAQLCKVLPGCGGVPVGFPAAAAGKILAAVLNKAHYIFQRIA